MTVRRAIPIVSVIAGVLIAGTLGIGAYLRHTQTLSVKAFGSEYSAADAFARVALSEKYLAHYPASVLLDAIEKKYPDRVCHVQAHAFGRAIYKLHPNLADAIGQCGASCTYGCFHGVLMQMFSTNSDTLGGVIEDESQEQYLAHVRDMARDLCTNPEVHDAVRLRVCYHGLGHVFQSMQGDVSKSLELCHMWNSTGAEAACATGVFMEYLSATSSASILNTKGSEPCSSYPGDEYWCYSYKAFGWLKAWGNVKSALRGCDAFGKGAIPCIRYTAEAQAVLTWIYSDADIDALCNDLEGDKRKECVKGVMIRNYDLNAGEDATHSCDLVTGRYHQQCLDDVHAYSLKAFVN